MAVKASNILRLQSQPHGNYVWVLVPWVDGSNKSKNSQTDVFIFNTYKVKPLTLIIVCV